MDRPTSLASVASAAISLANIAKQYRLGTFFGEETGGLTSTYIRLNGCRLPNSKLALYVSDKYEALLWHHWSTWSDA